MPAWEDSVRRLTLPTLDDVVTVHTKRLCCTLLCSEIAYSLVNIILFSVWKGDMHAWQYWPLVIYDGLALVLLSLSILLFMVKGQTALLRVVVHCVLQFSPLWLCFVSGFKYQLLILLSVSGIPLIRRKYAHALLILPLLYVLWFYSADARGWEWAWFPHTRNALPLTLHTILHLWYSVISVLALFGLQFAASWGSVELYEILDSCSEVSNSIAAMRLSSLHEIPHDSDLHDALGRILHNLRLFQPFIPAAVIRQVQLAAEDEESDRPVPDGDPTRRATTTTLTPATPPLSSQSDQVFVNPVDALSRVSSHWSSRTKRVTSAGFSRRGSDSTISSRSGPPSRTTSARGSARLANALAYRPVTIVSTRLTGTQEYLNVTELTDATAKYLSLAERIAKEERGVIQSLFGEMLMVTFNAASQCAGHSVSAVRFSIRLINAWKEAVGIGDGADIGVEADNCVLWPFSVNCSIVSSKMYIGNVNLKSKVQTHEIYGGWPQFAVSLSQFNEVVNTAILMHGSMWDSVAPFAHLIPVDIIEDWQHQVTTVLTPISLREECNEEWMYTLDSSLDTSLEALYRSFNILGQWPNPTAVEKAIKEIEQYATFEVTSGSALNVSSGSAASQVGSSPFLTHIQPHCVRVLKDVQQMTQYCWKWSHPWSKFFVGKGKDVSHESLLNASAVTTWACQNTKFIWKLIDKMMQSSTAWGDHLVHARALQPRTK
eukprot:TRINITY_DN67904_c4_g1_i3.p1 TRINITY_DN67904_c4_g1~~TRINITY_DN67904_c4_g1_i3.p1  ORF type:complete len:716 (+),score=-41.67 TRINITY_DN67904_c4_g1_i3:31-2178(+)